MKSRLPYADVARLVMSGMAGRPLRLDEEVRPIDGDVANCTPENLELWCEGTCLGKPVHWLVANARWVIAMYGPGAA